MVVDIEYVVDITKPPLGPPCRLIVEGSDPRIVNEPRMKSYDIYIRSYMELLNGSRQK